MHSFKNKSPQINAEGILNCDVCKENLFIEVKNCLSFDYACTVKTCSQLHNLLEKHVEDGSILAIVM